MGTQGQWTGAGIAFTQIALAHDDLMSVQHRILAGDEHAALEKITTVIRQLEAARRMIRGY